MKSKGIRLTNEKLLLRIMHRRGVVTQAELAQETGLQPSTVFRIFRSMEDRGLIRQIEGKEPDTPKQGRRPGYYDLNPGAGYSVGVDLSQSTTAVLLVDLKGNPVRDHAVELPSGTSTAGVVELILDTVEKVFRSEKIDRSLLLGVGIGAPGVIDIEKGEVIKYSRFPDMEGLPLQRDIGDSLQVPVFVHNNASVIALAENRFGRAVGHESVVAFLIRSGVGGAFIKDGQIYTSQGMTAFELGHMTLNRSSVAASHKDETLEDFLSESALLKFIGQKDPSITTLEKLVEYMDSGESGDCPALKDVSRVFTEQARNIALMLNPEAFVIITRYRTIAEYFARHLERELSGPDKTGRFNIGTVIPLEYDPILACRGAADLVFDSFFDSK